MQMRTCDGYHGPTILVVDDDPAVRNSLQFSLEVEGFCVRTYPDAASLMKEASLPEKGCLVVDFRLPGMNGLELVAQLRKRRIALPAVLVTTRPDATVRLHAAKAGISIIEKPLLTEDLLRCIRTMLKAGADA
jgi:FixJ family two-component response regulator